MTESARCSASLTDKMSGEGGRFEWILVDSETSRRSFRLIVKVLTDDNAVKVAEIIIDPLSRVVTCGAIVKSIWYLKVMKMKMKKKT